MAHYLTRQQKLLLDYLREEAGSAFHVAELVERLRQNGTCIGVATVYRQLENLERQGCIHKAVTEEGTYYRYCSPESPEHCILFKCESCGEIRHIDCESFAPLYRHMEQQHHFRVNPRRTVLYGLCAVCQGEAQ